MQTESDRGAARTILATAQAGSIRNGLPASALRLFLLGGFELRQGVKSVELPFASQRLVALLALKRQQVGRDTAARALWPCGVHKSGFMPRGCIRGSVRPGDLDA